MDELVISEMLVDEIERRVDQLDRQFDEGVGPIAVAGAILSVAASGQRVVEGCRPLSLRMLSGVSARRSAADSLTIASRVSEVDDVKGTCDRRE